MSICICGGGNIAHAWAAVLSNCENVVVYTRQPHRWSSRLGYVQGDDLTTILSNNNIVATNDLSVVGEMDMVVLTYPRNVLAMMLEKIEPALRSGQKVLFCPAPADMEKIVSRLSHRGVDVVGFQRVPNVARVREYGKTVWIGEARKVTRIACSRGEIADEISEFIESRFGGHVEQLTSFLSFTFSNSNPLLHPARLVELLRGGNGGAYKQCPYFYAEWTDESSWLYIKADEEMRSVFERYSKSAVESDYESVLEHYESKSPGELTRKMRSIRSLAHILAPWKLGENDLWHPDYTSRYFSEDIPYGTMVIQQYAHAMGLTVPTIDYLVESIMGVRNA